MGWHEHSPDLFVGTEKFFRPGYVANLVSNWLPKLSGVVAKLEKGAKVADVGCGHGSSTIVMAKAFPNSHFVGFDYHEPSVREARAQAKRAGVDRSVEFEVAAAQSYPGSGRPRGLLRLPARHGRPEGRRPTFVRPSNPTGRGWSSSRWPARPSRRT